jgi:hypothetical protein
MLGWSLAQGRTVLLEHPEAELPPLLVDDFIDTYVSWREACTDVEDAYASWLEAEDVDRALAFVAYHAALDREEHAASFHLGCATKLREAVGLTSR